MTNIPSDHWRENFAIVMVTVCIPCKKPFLFFLRHFLPSFHSLSTLKCHNYARIDIKFLALTNYFSLSSDWLHEHGFWHEVLEG
jgi:hypothetical protein